MENNLFDHNLVQILCCSNISIVLFSCHILKETNQETKLDQQKSFRKVFMNYLEGTFIKNLSYKMKKHLKTLWYKVWRIRQTIYPLVLLSWPDTENRDAFQWDPDELCGNTPKDNFSKRILVIFLTFLPSPD